MAGEKRFSTLNFYKTELNEAKNAYVDDLEDYLETCTITEQVDNFQYIRHELNISIKLDKDQSFVNDFNYNYLKIVNTLGIADENFVGYYFITKTTQVAPETILIDLKMDTVNSLGQGETAGGNPRNFLPTTNIQRQHKSRFIKPVSWNPNTDVTLYRNIHPQSEGIIPQQIKWVDNKLDSTDGLDWYLIYRNREQVDVSHPNPAVETLLCANEDITIGTQSWGDSKTFVASDFAEGNYYYFLNVDDPIGEFSIDNGTRRRFGTATKSIATGATGQYYPQAAYWETTINYSTIPLTALIIKREGNQLKYRLWDNRNVTFGDFSGSASNVSISIQNDTSFTNCTSITFYEANFLRYSTQNYINQTPVGIQALVKQRLGVYVGSHTTQTLSTIDDLDRTDSRLIKIIKLPYCPIKYTKTGDIYDFDENWVYDLGLLRYDKDNIPEFENNNAVYASLLIDPTLLLLDSTPSYRDTKNIKYESKLYHSDITSYKLVYDSFSQLIKPELFTKNSLPNPIIPVDFKPTSTINSKFGFRLNYQNYGNYASEEDFGVLLTTRNNEETILNNEYLNYIKTGYNYDKKAQTLQVEQAQRGAAVSTIGSIGSIVAGIIDVAVGTKALGAGMIASGVAGLAGAANAWTNVQKTVDANNNAMESKLAQLRAQSTSTSGTDDVDLMSWYSDNRLHQMIYRPTTEVLYQLYHVFDLTGYIDNNNWTPDVDSRIWYNYVQCQPELDFDTTKGYKNSWLEDLKGKYNNGVTVYHHNNIGGQYDKWNFDQQWENWEKWIVEGVANE